MSLRQALQPFRRAARAPVALYRWHLGWLLGHRFVLLVHIGRRTGLERRTVLEVVRYEPHTEEVVVMSGLGHRSDWYQNIHINPPKEITLGRRSFTPTLRDLTPTEAAEAIADYERRNRLLAPVIRRVLSRLVGWDYDGSEASRQRLVQERPLIAFSPK